MIDMKSREFKNIQPGDIGFDGGKGISGLIIRIGTGSAYGHCFVYHKYLGGNKWETVEAGPKGVRLKHRTGPANKVVRVWRDELERQRLIRVSSLLRGCKYGWGEIARIVLHLVGFNIRSKDNPKRVICSNHVAQAVLAARPEFILNMDYRNYEIWPGELAVSLDEFLWNEEGQYNDTCS